MILRVSQKLAFNDKKDLNYYLEGHCSNSLVYPKIFVNSLQEELIKKTAHYGKILMNLVVTAIASVLLQFASISTRSDGITN